MIRATFSLSFMYFKANCYCIFGSITQTLKVKQIENFHSYTFIICYRNIFTVERSSTILVCFYLRLRSVTLEFRSQRKLSKKMRFFNCSPILFLSLIIAFSEGYLAPSYQQSIVTAPYQVSKCYVNQFFVCCLSVELKFYRLMLSIILLVKRICFRVNYTQIN